LLRFDFKFKMKLNKIDLIQIRYLEGYKFKQRVNLEEEKNTP